MGIPNIVLPSKDNVDYLVGDPTYSNQISITIPFNEIVIEFLTELSHSILTSPLAKKYSDINIKERRALGELDHPDSSVVNLNNVSHNITEMHWQDNDLVGTVEVLSTPSGNILKELFKCGIKLGISSRGLGSVKELGEGKAEVQDDFELIAFDFVSNPSTQGAFLAPVNESIQHGLVKPAKYAKVNRLITDILSDIK